MDDNRLDNLLAYTTFHIGLYTTLGTAFIAASVIGPAGGWLVKWCVACFFVAGVCGGVIGSNIPAHKDFTSFEAATLGFWGIGLFKYDTWVRIEHLAFWLGNAPVAIGFLIWGTSIFKEN